MLGPAIFFIPHQDDETLQAAIDILIHLAAGREVIIVLYTTGKGSFVQDVLNGNGTSAYMGAHNPYIEGYEPLTDDDFSAARNREFRSALGQLGVPPENIHLQAIDSDGDPVTKASVKSLIMKYVNIYGASGVSYKAMSYYDTSDSHKYSGQALLELYTAGIVTDARFYIARSDWSLSRPGTVYTATVAQKEKIKKAARCYEAYNPVSGAHAIGYHSVYAQFNAYLANPQNKIHKPNE